MPDHYSKPDGRKRVSHSWNPIQLFKNPNPIGVVSLLALILAVTGVTALVRKLIRGGRNRRYGGGYRRKGLFGR